MTTNTTAPRLALEITPPGADPIIVPCVLEHETISIGRAWVHGIAPFVNPFDACDPDGRVVGSIVYAIAEGGECSGTVEDWSAEFGERAPCFEGLASWRLIYNGADVEAWADENRHDENAHADSIADGLDFHLSTWRDALSIDPTLDVQPIELWAETPAAYCF